MLSNELLEILRSFGSMVEGQLGEEVMDDMIMRNIVEEESSLPPKEITIDSSSCTALESPLVLPVVGHFGVGVVQVSDHDKPMGDLKPRDTIVLDYFGCTKDGAGVGDAPCHSEDSDVGGYNSITLSWVEDDRVGCAGGVR